MIETETIITFNNEVKIQQEEITEELLQKIEQVKSLLNHKSYEKLWSDFDILTILKMTHPPFNVHDAVELIKKQGKPIEWKPAKKVKKKGQIIQKAPLIHLKSNNEEKQEESEKPKEPRNQKKNRYKHKENNRKNDESYNNQRGSTGYKRYNKKKLQ